MHMNRRVNYEENEIALTDTSEEVILPPDSLGSDPILSLAAVRIHLRSSLQELISCFNEDRSEVIITTDDGSGSDCVSRKDLIASTESISGYCSCLVAAMIKCVPGRAELQYKENKKQKRVS